jgi:exonuclease III
VQDGGVNDGTEEITNNGIDDSNCDDNHNEGARCIIDNYSNYNGRDVTNDNTEDHRNEDTTRDMNGTTRNEDTTRDMNGKNRNEDTTRDMNGNNNDEKSARRKLLTTKLAKQLTAKMNKHVGICIGHLNMRSLLPKIEDIEILLANSNMDILTLSETWLDHTIQHEIHIGGYTVIRKDRNRHGGGVMMYIREGIDYKERQDLEHERLEATWIEVPNLIGKANTLICSYYRPPEKKLDYFNDTLDMINKAEEENKNMIICGDFNWDYKLDESLANNKAKQIEDLFMLSQIIDKPTRTENGDKILDLILTTKPSDHIYTDVLPLGCSDHYMPYSIINAQRVPQFHRHATMRNYKNFKEKDFLDDLIKCKLKKEMEDNNLNNAAQQPELSYKLQANWESWKEEFLQISQKHAPLRTVRMKSHSRSWISVDIVKLMNERDHMKVVASRTKNQEDWTKYRQLRNKVNRIIKKAKADYYEDLTQQKMGNTKFWKEMTKLMPKKLDTSSIPKNLTLDELNTYFSEIGSKTISDASTNKQKPGLIWKGPNCIYDFEIHTITEDDVEYHLRKLKLITNTDILGLDCKLLRLSRNIISKDLAKVRKIHQTIDQYLLSAM